MPARKPGKINGFAHAKVDGREQQKQKQKPKQEPKQEPYLYL